MSNTFATSARFCGPSEIDLHGFTEVNIVSASGEVATHEGPGQICSDGYRTVVISQLHRTAVSEMAHS